MIKPFLEKPWTTYIGVLVKVLNVSDGDVVELGAGPFSTPLLHWICKDMHRNLISYENDPDYYEFAKQFRSYFHKVVFVKDWEKVDSETKRGVVFIDHRPITRRLAELIKFKNAADYVVIHDTDNTDYYNDISKHYKHVYTWKKCRPWTSVASNFKDLSILR